MTTTFACAALVAALLGAGLDVKGRAATDEVASQPTRWLPRPGLVWQYQLSGRIDTTVQADVFDLDGFSADPLVITRLRDLGARTVCYIEGGAWEANAPDANNFPAAVLGEYESQSPGYRWLDVRAISLLQPLMAARADLCKAKGFDGIEWDDVTGYRARSGFPLTPDDQLAYNRMLARLSHDRGLAVGLKNDIEQVAGLVTDFDFAVNESCIEFAECDRVLPFVSAGKAVFHVEYQGAPADL